MVSSTTVASHPHAPVQFGLSVVRITRASPLGCAPRFRPGTECRVAIYSSLGTRGALLPVSGVEFGAAMIGVIGRKNLGAASWLLWIALNVSTS